MFSRATNLCVFTVKLLVSETMNQYPKVVRVFISFQLAWNNKCFHEPGSQMTDSVFWFRKGKKKKTCLMLWHVDINVL